MSRDQRLHDNWALLYAQQRALETNSPLCIIFCLTSNFPQANIRSYGFMLRGLKLLQLDCENYSLPFYLLKGSPEQIIPRFCSENSVKTLITDFSPLFISKQWKQQISSQTPDDLLFLEVRSSLSLLCDAPLSAPLLLFDLCACRLILITSVQ
jgi:deoxyribodipyrimidine photo-lyase